MTFIWFLAWMFKGRPKVEMGSTWNPWGIALVTSAVIDVANAVAGPRRWAKRPVIKEAAKPAA